MGCEDCKNYEPKGKHPQKELLQDLMDAMKPICCGKQCNECDMGNAVDDCNLRALFVQLVTKGAHW